MRVHLRNCTQPPTICCLPGHQEMNREKLHRTKYDDNKNDADDHDDDTAWNAADDKVDSLQSKSNTTQFSYFDHLGLQP